MNRRNLLWGIFFICLAVYAVVNRLGILPLPGISLHRLVLTLLFVWLFTDGIRHLNFYKILFPLAFLAILYDDLPVIEALTPWTVLFAALFGSIGLSMIFPGGRRSIHLMMSSGEDTQSFGSEQCTGEHIRCENNFGTAIRYIHSANFHSAELENNFGTLSVYFDNAVIADGSAFVTAESNFGTLNLYIPKEWETQHALDRAFGSIHENGICTASSGIVLQIEGSANFGAINLFYI